MDNRAEAIAAFIKTAGWGDAGHVPVQADFSSRRFTRLERPNGTRAILMDADADQKTAQFAMIAGLLRKLDLSAPELYAADENHGLLLMEDFGDGNFGRSIDSGTAASPLYRRAVDVLVHLHQRFDKSLAKELNLPIFNGALFAAQVELFLDAWFPFAKDREPTFEEAESFRAAWKEILKGIESLPQTFILRDFMPDNLMDLPQRKEWRSAGLLDFQDGGIGPAPYDLASLCETVRREGGDLMLDEMVGYYCEKSGMPLSKTELRSACRVLAAQRHTRILGIVANRVMKTGNRDKLEWAPRIWGYLGDLLHDNALAPFREWIRAHILTDGIKVK